MTNYTYMDKWTVADSLTLALDLYPLAIPPQKTAHLLEYNVAVELVLRINKRNNYFFCVLYNVHGKLQKYSTQTN